MSGLPDEAVEAMAVAAFDADYRGGHIRGSWTWAMLPEDGRENYRALVRATWAALPAGVYRSDGQGHVEPDRTGQAEIEDLEARLQARIRREGIYERALQEIAKTPHTGSPYSAWERARKALAEVAALSATDTEKAGGDPS